MPTFAEWEARRKGGGLAAPSAPMSASPDENTMPTSLGDAYAPGLADTPDSAYIHELMRTGKEAGIGLLRSPLDLAKNTVNTIIHPLDTLMGMGHAVAHPVDTAMELAKNPREAGSTLGQLLLAPKVPGAVNTALAEGPGIMGRGISAVGRGAEAVGTSKVLKSANRYGAIGTALSGHPGLAALELAAPPALEYGGRLAQRGGAALEGLDLAYKGLQDSVRRSGLKPIEKFLEDDPQARVGGEGRMTGQFEEGEGGLSDIASGNFTRNAVVSPTDARLTSMDMPPDAGMPTDFFDEGLRPLAETGRPTTLSLDALSRLVRSGKGAVR